MALQSNVAGRTGQSAEPVATGDGRVPIAIFNVKYSPNLGDGIIAECLERELRLANPVIDPVSIDLAGRSGWKSSTGRHRQLLLRIMEAMPHGLRAFLLPAALNALVALRLVPKWKEKLRGCRAAVVGGGALFADADQNFPIKVSRALDCCANQGLPVAIASVGVSPNWSTEGWQRVRASLLRCRLVSVTVRDRQSQTTWSGLVGADPLPLADLAPDPGLLSSRHFVTRRGRAARPRVAICLTDPLVLRLHGTDSDSEKRLSAWMMTLLHLLDNKGHDLSLFTNGSPEDEQFLTRLMGQLQMAGMISISRAPNFAEPEQLVRFIASQDCIVAHRLHACITAYSYRIPAVGLLWDAKLEAFFGAAGRQAYLVDTLAQSPFAAAHMVNAALQDPVEPELHARLLAEARKSIGRVAELLCENRTAA